MMKAATPAAARPAPTAPATESDDGRLKLQAFAGARPSPAPRVNWELRALGGVDFELASARD